MLVHCGSVPRWWMIPKLEMVKNYNSTVDCSVLQKKTFVSALWVPGFRGCELLKSTASQIQDDGLFHH